HKEKTLFPEHGQKDKKHIKGYQEEAEYPFILYIVCISRENTQIVSCTDQLFQNSCGAEKLPEKIFTEKIQGQEQYSQGAKEKVREFFPSAESEKECTGNCRNNTQFCGGKNREPGMKDKGEVQKTAAAGKEEQKKRTESSHQRAAFVLTEAFLLDRKLKIMVFLHSYPPKSQNDLCQSQVFFQSFRSGRKNLFFFPPKIQMSIQ